MHEDARIARRIASALAGSGLSMERRAEVAEELTGHIEQLIQARRDDGLPEAEAIEAALREFGDPRVIRRELRRQQRRLDRREALAKLRRRAWLLLAVYGVLALVPATLSPGPVSWWSRVTAGLAFLICVGAATAVSVLLLSPLEYAIRRQRPRSEYHFAGRLLHWLAVAGAGVVAVAVFAFGTLASLTPLLRETEPAAMRFWPLIRNFGIAWVESAGRNFALVGLLWLGFGLGAALYERSRCCDGPGTPIAE